MKAMRLKNSPISYYIDDRAGGDWVVFIHAAFVDSGMFEAQFGYFSGKYNLLAIDVLGHGGSVPAKKGDGIEKTADWIALIFEAHGISAAHFVGVSLGAALGQDFADRYEDKVLSLACFGGYDRRFQTKMPKNNAKEHVFMILKGFISMRWFAKANKKISAHTPAAQEAFYRMNLRFKKSSFRYLAHWNAPVGKAPEGARKYALLVGCGEYDLPGEIEIVNDWAARERCEKAILPGAGHCVNMDVPQAFNALLETFWSKRKNTK